MVATKNLLLNNSIKHSTIGDLPVPPITKFPTQITGKLNSAERTIFLLYNQFLIIITKPYSSENGNNNILNERRKKELKFMYHLPVKLKFIEEKTEGNVLLIMPAHVQMLHLYVCLKGCLQFLHTHSILQSPLHNS